MVNYTNWQFTAEEDYAHPPSSTSLLFPIPLQMARHISEWHLGTRKDGKGSVSGVNRASCLPLHVPSQLLAFKPNGTASPACCTAGRGRRAGGWRHAAQSSHVLAARVALKAQRQEGGRASGRSANSFSRDLTVAPDARTYLLDILH